MHRYVLATLLASLTVRSLPSRWRSALERDKINNNNLHLWKVYSLKQEEAFDRLPVAESAAICFSNGTAYTEHTRFFSCS